MKAVYKYPGEPAEVIDINNDLATLQHLVDGYIETVPEAVHVPNRGSFAYVLILNEEGKLRGMQENVFPAAQTGDVYVGPVVCLCVIQQHNRIVDLNGEIAVLRRENEQLRTMLACVVEALIDPEDIARWRAAKGGSKGDV